MPYYVFEGPDGCGKTTLLHKVAESLREYQHLSDKIETTRSPGQTALGKKLRQLVLEDDLNIDYLSRQILFMADTVSYYNQYLIPKLQNDPFSVVLQDRSSYISSVIYGMSDGLELDPLVRMLSIYKPLKPSKLFVLTTSAETCYARRVAGESKNVYDVKPIEFYQKCCGYYNDLLIDQRLRLVVSELVYLDNVIFIDNGPIEEMVREVAGIIFHDLGNLSKQTSGLR